MNICDFCSAPDPPHLEPARDFEVSPGPVGVSTGGWASCQTCHELIARDDWLGLEARAIDAMRTSHPGASKRDLRLSVQTIQRQFRLHRA